MLTLKKTAITPIPGIILLVIALLVSLFIYQDYGVSYDEFAQRDMGVVSYNYIFEGDTTLNHYHERDHGVGFELPLYAAEKAMGITDTRDMYLMRHLASHIFFLLSVFFGYLLALRLFKDQVISCLVLLLLLLHPRLYAHSYFNSKDLPFMSAITISFYFVSVAFDKNKYVWYAVLGALLGYATSIRITGILPFVIIAGFLVLDLALAIFKKKEWLRSLFSLCIYSMFFMLALYTFWPALWKSPVATFVGVFESLAHYRWDGSVVFDGHMIKASELPRRYLPVWFSITTPIAILIAGFLGFEWLIVNMIRKPLQFIENTPQRNFVIHLLCVAGGFLSIIVLRSVVYDDWRHIYFVYPGFVFLVGYFLHMMSATRARVFVFIGAGIQMVVVLINMVMLHPFQQVYFNRILPHNEEYLRKNWDYDYWAPSYKHAYEYLLRTEKADVIKIWGKHQHWDEGFYIPLWENRDILPADQRGRIQLVHNREEADYYMTTFRVHPEDYEGYGRVYYDLKLQNSTVVRIYKLKD